MNLIAALILAAHVPAWYVEITSPNFPKPFDVAGGYSSQQQCQDMLPDIVTEWSAKKYPSNSPNKGKNIFGNVTAVCKLDSQSNS